MLALAPPGQSLPPAPRPDFELLDGIVQSGITRGIYPAAVLLIGRRDSVLYARGYGHSTWDPASSVPTTDSTIWDIASLTKVTATTPAIMRLVEQRRIALDQPVSAYLPRFAGGRKAEVTVRMLLQHTSGLPAYLQFFRLTPTRDSAITLLYATPLRHPPGQVAEYSDLNFLLLGLLVERVTQEPLDRFATQEVFLPAEMRSTMFTPPASLHSRVIPTGVWHGHPSRGAVNAKTAVRFGGVAGHAGLFTTGADLARYARLWLAQGMSDGRPVFAPGTVRLFLERGASSGNRLLGWESPEPPGPDPVASGTLLTAAAFGHTGWTGTEMWIDPTRDLFIVFLTNRSYSPRLSHSIRELRAVRARLADAVVRAVPGACSSTIQPAC